MIEQETSYCGCCGQQNDTDIFWCDDCYTHLDFSQKSYNKHLWERTYYAQYEKPCPFANIPLEDRGRVQAERTSTNGKSGTVIG